ncbi:hypothetical protein BKA63DRAFT_424745 [Paraphoma chrysanthemicola]|nr:hypothetical protein BKA63DRAFT_424745 [Paraphoma chrysanthemicola]
MFGSSDADEAASETSEDEDASQQVKARLNTRKRRRAASSSGSDQDADKVTVTKAKRRRKRTLSQEQSEDNDELRLPRSKRLKVVRREPSVEEESEVEDEHKDITKDDIEEQSPPRTRRRLSRRQATPSSEEVEELEQVSSQTKRRKRQRRAVTPSEDEDVEEGSQSGQGGGDEEEREDLQQDLAFLRSSPLPDRGKLRSTHEKPKNERQKALEALKRRRAGASEPSSSTTPGRSRRVVLESDTDPELEIIKEEPESDIEITSNTDDAEDDDDEAQESERDANALDMFLEDDQDQGFIDDDEGPIGEPILNPDDFMPLIAARLSSAKPKELFKYAIEWMVMKKIHPGFDSNSQVYDITFRKLDDEVKGLANSKFSSSAWTADFTRAIRARPDLMSMEIIAIKRDTMDLYCQACNRKNHPATWELMLTGQPYNKETLEPLEIDTDSDSNSDDVSELSADSEVELNGEKPAFNADGERLPPESKRFALGKTCKANAQVAHTLHHWRYHLYSWVKDYLARAGHLAADKLVKRDGWTDKKREKAALKIVKSMEGDGEIKKLYHLYKDQVAYAVEVRHDLNRWGRG